MIKCYCSFRYSGGPPIPRTFIYLYLSDSRDDDDDNDDNEVTDIRLPKEASIRELYEMVCAKTVVSLEKVCNLKSCHFYI